MESRSGATGGDRGHLDNHRRQVLLLRPAAAWSYASASGGVSWPTQRSPSSSYTCGYCKREFRSAQALGGHMNVHRRERAMIRHYYSSSFPVAPAPAPAAVHRDWVPNLNFSPPHCAGGDYGGTSTPAPAVYSFFSPAAAAEGAKAALAVDLELGAGGLDLELRLGCS
ncbi:Transcriptional regulator SUPERMAN [Hordeum vulgare]|uniref:C2H2-type domain-containing protein n=1 Tax=Hordeum vulgare subsp. vulgare TaxID=112509 RepID=A0A8I6WIX2_HORVV|nr:uncharacterized protein LOC123418709 [Hordeum vulgare subsp. vulgare]KAE8794824.1 Transcriptional regulator SUPERMAN [Hordeum vulgare]KAI5020115.1 hypothetical protein ZWY2020_045003 [Hordeum vulgare]